MCYVCINRATKAKESVNRCQYMFIYHKENMHLLFFNDKTENYGLPQKIAQTNFVTSAIDVFGIMFIITFIVMFMLNYDKPVVISGENRVRSEKPPTHFKSLATS